MHNLPCEEMRVFNFFDELKKSLKNEKFIDKYNIVLVSGKMLYAEGHTGICQLSSEVISFKYKGGIIVVEGKELVLNELLETTLKITGEIKKVEAM